MNRKLKRAIKNTPVTTNASGAVNTKISREEFEFHKTLSIINELHFKKEYREAIQLCNRLLAKYQTNITLLEKLSVMLAETKEYETSLKVISLIKKINPKMPSPYLNSAIIFCELGQMDKAKEEALKAYEIDKKSEGVNHRLAYISMIQKDHQTALKCLKRLLDINPKNPWANACLASLLYFDMDSEDAKKYLKRAYEATGMAYMEVNYKLYLPIITKDLEDIERVRREYEHNLDELLQKDLRIDNPHNAISRTSFYLAYHGFNNRDIMIKLAKLYEKVCPSLSYTAPHCIDYKGKKRGEKIKVGFISMYFGTHSVGRVFNHLVARISEVENIEGYLLPVVNNKDRDLKIHDPAFVKLVQVVKNYLIIETIDIEKARREVADLELDVLVYTDIGMDQFTYCFAFARLAPIQCLLLGHPDTTGIKNVDYCFTSKWLDTEDGQNYFSEKLLYFNGSSAIYGDVKPPENPISKKDLGYSETANLYVCPMKNQKIHPDFDLAVKGILQKDKNAEVYFFEDRGDRTDIVFDRLKKILTPEQFKRIKELPWMEPARFWNAIYQADVILDTFHFGAGTTAYQVIGIGTPLINLPADTGKGRASYSLYKYIDLTDTIANDLNDYIAKAIKFANDKQLNQEFRAKVLANNSKLFNNFSVVPEIINFFEDKVYGLQDN